jgi:hypothetical protein
VLIVGTVGDEEEQARSREPFNQAIQQRLRLAVNPVEVLSDQKDGLDLAFSDQ